MFSFQPVTVDDVAVELRKLQSRKSVGQDGVPNELLKLSCLQIAQHLTTLFNRSLSEGVFPRSLKDAILAPQLKYGKDAALPIFYRPIALLSNISKVFERLVHKQLMTHCLTKGILPDEQFDFLKGRSAKWQLLYLLQRWHEALDKKRCVHAVFLDAAKAFDRVDHSMLLSKLCGIGLDGPALSWLRSYLSDRRIMSRVDDAVSDPLHITSGVPQGSVLGPLLFIIYFKDIPSVTQACSALFADDTLLFHDDCQGANGCCSLSSDLSDISTWAAQSNVSFNATKSAELRLGRTASSDALSLDGHCVNRVSSKLHLGATLAANLSWNDHVNRVLQNISGSLALCKNLGYRHRLPSKPLRIFFLAYMRPRLEYCSAVWSGCPRRLQLRLEKVQIQAARAITRVYNLPNHQLLHLAN